MRISDWSRPFCRAILPIQNATEGFCSDDQCVLRRSCPDHAFRHRKGIEEAGANGGDVKGDTIRDAKRGLHLGRAGWKCLVRCGGRQNDQVDVAGLHSRCVDRLEAGRSEEHTSELQSLMRISYAVFCLKKKK